MKRWVLTILLQIDELISAIFGGYANETISYRLALNASQGGRFGCWFCKWVESIWPGHCSMDQPSKAQQLSRLAKLSADYNSYQLHRGRLPKPLKNKD